MFACTYAVGAAPCAFWGSLHVRIKTHHMIGSWTGVTQNDLTTLLTHLTIVLMIGLITISILINYERRRPYIKYKWLESVQNNRVCSLQHVRSVELSEFSLSWLTLLLLLGALGFLTLGTAAPTVGSITYWETVKITLTIIILTTLREGTIGEWGAKQVSVIPNKNKEFSIIQQFGISKILISMFLKSLILRKAAFIWSTTQ